MSSSCIKKIFFLCLIVVGIFPVTTHAQIDQRCWLEQECYDARASLFGGEKPKIGEVGWDKVFRQDNTTKKLCGGDKDALNKKIGFCLPATTAKTKISIGGQTEFTGLTEFVSFIYTYGLSVASLLAILMIIVAGVQWTLSGGNTEAISGAQHKIYGAVIGLVILAAAYTILYTVNPDLVNLRPPNAWMINTQKIGAPYCSDVTDGLISKDPSNATGEILTSEEKQAGFALVSATDWVSTSTAACGNDYYVQKTGALTCTGTACPEGQVCYDKQNQGKPGCFEANFAGVIRSSNAEAYIAELIGGLAGTIRGIFGEGWTYPWVGADSTKEMEIYMVCQNGEHHKLDIEYPQDPVENLNRGAQTQNYALSTSNEEIKKAWKSCDANSGHKGFVLAAEFNEVGERCGASLLIPLASGGCEEHMLGRSHIDPTEAYDLMNSSNDWTKCIFRNAPQIHFFSDTDLIKGIKLNIDAGKVIDIDNETEEDVSKKIYYAGNKPPKGAENPGTENCNQ